jgi:hypothetical protein
MANATSKEITTSKEVVTLGSRTPEQLRNDATLTPGQRRKLLKQFFLAKLQLRQDQFTAALDLERFNLTALVETGKKQIEADKVARELQIRSVVINMIADVGIDVDIAQGQTLKKLAEEMKRFRAEVDSADIDPDDKEVLKQFSKGAFVRTSNLLARLAADLNDKAGEQID